MALTKLNNQSLVAVTSAGIPIRSGSVLQVVSATHSTEVSTSSTSAYVTTGLTATITPSNSSSKILVLFNAPMYNNLNASNAIATVFRGTVSGTNLGTTGHGFGSSYGDSATVKNVVAGSFLDSPSTTSATTYTVGMKTSGATTGSISSYMCAGGEKAVLTLMEIAG
jgi:hypothetical protein